MTSDVTMTTPSVVTVEDTADRRAYVSDTLPSSTFCPPTPARKADGEMLQCEQLLDGKINGGVSLALLSRRSLSSLTDGFYYFTISDFAL